MRELDVNKALDKARAEGEELFITSDCSLKEIMIGMKEEGRKFAQKEIDDLKVINKSLELSLSMTEKEVRDKKAEKQEQVRNLKEAKECLQTHKLEFSAFNNTCITGKNIKCKNTICTLNNNFPDCAEQSKGKMITSVEVYDEKYLKKVL